jgi:hypothetical protein
VGIEEGVTGLLADPNDAQSFAVQVAALSEATRWQAYSHAGSERVRRLFSFEVMTQRYLDLLEEIRQGAYPLGTSRAALAPHVRSLFTWRDYVPEAVRRYGGVVWRSCKRLL